MKMNEIIKTIEKFAPLELQEAWDNSGIQIDFGNTDVKKILLALTVTEDIVNQAIQKKCDMIISHHPLFFIPFSLQKGISIYSAHTNLDSTKGGTTDTMISMLEMEVSECIGNFLRVVDLDKEIELRDFIQLVKEKLGLDYIRVVNNFNKQKIKKIAFCAGSGADFLPLAQDIKADVFVTGDIKYHTAIDSGIILLDAGHFESEHPVLNTVKELLMEEFKGIEVLIADEKSPFINY